MVMLGSICERRRRTKVIAMTQQTSVSRLPALADPPDDPLLRELFAETRRRGGQVINLHLTLGHAPKVFKARRIMATTLRYETAVPRVLCELAIIRTAQIAGGDYELNQHIPMGLEAGLTRQQLDEIENWEDSDLFDDRQLAVLAYVEAMAGGDGEVDDHTFAELARFFTPQEIVELTVTIATYYGTALIIKALGIRIEDDGRRTI
jgi:alkylhydroperoxidase family enzyme